MAWIAWCYCFVVKCFIELNQQLTTKHYRTIAATQQAPTDPSITPQHTPKHHRPSPIHTPRTVTQRMRALHLLSTPSPTPCGARVWVSWPHTATPPGASTTTPHTNTSQLGRHTGSFRVHAMALAWHLCSACSHCLLHVHTGFSHQPAHHAPTNWRCLGALLLVFRSGDLSNANGCAHVSQLGSCGAGYQLCAIHPTDIFSSPGTPPAAALIGL